jgi:hypothetical protein
MSIGIEGGTEDDKRLQLHLEKNKNYRGLGVFIELGFESGPDGNLEMRYIFSKGGKINQCTTYEVFDGLGWIY